MNGRKTHIWKPSPRAVTFLTFAVTAGGVASFASNSARAECPTASSAPTTSILFDATWSPGIRAEIFKNLKVSLKLQGYVGCASFDTRSAATIHISKDTPALAPPASRIFIEIDWRGFPPLRVSRWLDVSGFDSDARSLAIVIAADELFTMGSDRRKNRRRRATLARIPPPASPHFQGSTVVTTRSTPETRGTLREHWLNVGPTVSAYTANEVVLFGAAVDVEMRFADRWALRAGGDIGIDPGRNTTGGQISQRQLSAVVGLVTYLFDTESVSLALEIDGVGGWLHVRGKPSAGYVGTALDRGIIVARGGFSAAWKAPSFRCQLLVLGGAPLLGVAAVEDGQRRSGLFGPMLTAALRVGLDL